MRNLILIAPPVAGKGTQAKLLCKKYGLIHISTGDLLRKAALTDAALQEKINAGEIIDDAIVLNLLKDAINSYSGSYILDGFPRDMEQAISFDKIFNDVYSVIYIDISKDVAKNRILGRLYCPNCGASYNEFNDDNRPELQGVCDKCSSTLKKREDDNLITLEMRFDAYISHTLPLLDYYRERQRLYTVNGNQSTMEVYNDIIQVLEGEI